MQNRLASYTLAYGLWILSIGLALLAAMIVRETVIFALSALFSAPPQRYTVHLGTQLITLFLGLILLIAIVILENRYRIGLVKGRTVGYFIRFVGIALLVVAVTHFLYIAVDLGLGALDQFRLAAALAEAVLGVIALRLARRTYRQ